MGGLGLTNTRAMNLALMLKWVWRILQPDTHNSLWFKILAAKYPNSISLFSPGSQFWISILKIRHIFRSGARFHIQNGRGTRFWLDRWRGDAPLAARFPTLFAICSDQTISVNQALEAPHLNIHFRRSLNPADLESWSALREELALCNLSEGQDRVSWALEPSGLFSVNSMYNHLLQGAAWPCAKFIWKAKLPLKIKIFTWQLAINRLPCSEQINHRFGPSDGLCVLCG
jgi:hypothetical protein